MRRRALLAHAAGVAVAAPLSAAAQGGAVPVIGFLRSTGEADSNYLVEGFRRGLAEHGLVEGRNIVVEYRWGDNRRERLPGLVAELLERRVAAIVANSDAARAARSATPSIPIVFVVGEDPIRLGLVSSLARPSGNVTGIAFLATELAAKRLGMLHELTPRLATIGLLLDPGAPGFATELQSIEDAGRTVGRRILIVKASTEGEIDAAFETFMRAGVLALYVGIGSLFSSRRERVTALATRHRLPAIYALRSFAEADGLISYGPDQADAYRRAAAYVVRILKGAKPADLPIEMPTKYELVINLRAARAIGYDVPASLLATADEVIE